jgi:hypothetical protein
VQVLEIVAILQLVQPWGRCNSRRPPIRLETARNAPPQSERWKVSNSKGQDSSEALLKQLLKTSFSIASHKGISGRKP